MIIKIKMYVENKVTNDKPYCTYTFMCLNNISLIHFYPWILF